MNKNRLNRKTSVFLIIFFYSLYINVLSAQLLQDTSYEPVALRPYSLEDVKKNMTAQLEIYPQEKVYLHTDRDFYVPGEKIWFKAYIADAHTHLHPTHSEYVYVELISPVDTLVNRVLVRAIDDMFYGHLPLPDVMQEGNYTLRTYTRYMENLGDDYFFKKNVRIAGSRGKSITNYELRITDHDKQNERGDDFDVAFFPEGGNLPEGVFSKIAFKALNKTGYPETITGVLIDENGAEITPIKSSHAGMGILGYLPEAGKQYRLKCKNENGLEKQFELPQSNPSAYALTTAFLKNDNLYVEIQRSIHAPDIPCYMLVHCRGIVIHFSEWDKEKRGIMIDREQLPAGVIQLVLFDGQMNPLSERLVFSKNDATEPIKFQTDQESYQIRDRIVSTLSLSPSLSGRAGERSGRAGERRSHFSVAITDDNDYTVDERTTILSGLLLSSELKGYIENPAYYLQDNPASNAALDLLMMTHGWRRYNIPEVMQGNPAYPVVPFQLFQEISGQVRTTTIFNKRPLPDSEILIAMKDGGVGVTSTGKDGSFSFGNLVFPDSSAFYIQALNTDGGDNVRLIVENESFPALVYAPQSPLPRLQTKEGETKDQSAGIEAFIGKAEKRTQFDADMWTLQLEEITITAPEVKKNDARLQFWANTSADKTITRETIEKYKYPYLHNYLILEGIQVVEHGNGAITFQIPGNYISFSGIPPMLVFIDGMEREFDKNTLSVNEIESIDVFKGAGASVFGARGAGGVVSITTRRGGGLSTQRGKTNYAVYSPLGYQKPVAFYSPIYETLEAKQSSIPDYRTTIFWKPDVIISREGQASFEFYTSDFKTTYSVVIEGITNDGKIVRQVEKIRVE
jgi:TonB-dependent SusC/RagA subfamily outer membrane receptor